MVLPGHSEGLGNIEVSSNVPACSAHFRPSRDDNMRRRIRVTLLQIVQIINYRLE